MFAQRTLQMRILLTLFKYKHILAIRGWTPRHISIFVSKWLKLSFFIQFEVILIKNHFDIYLMNMLFAFVFRTVKRKLFLIYCSLYCELQTIRTKYMVTIFKRNHHSILIKRFHINLANLCFFFLCFSLLHWLFVVIFLFLDKLLG